MAAQDVLQVALSQVGFKETPKGSNRGAEVDLYTGRRAEPWCAHFIAWCFRKTGKPLPSDVEPGPRRANPLASVAFMQRMFEEHGWAVREPAPGDVVFFATRGRSDKGPGRHVGFVAEVNLTHIVVVDGNWGDAVSKHSVRRDDPIIAGFGRRP